MRDDGDGERNWFLVMITAPLRLIGNIPTIILRIIALCAIAYGMYAGYVWYEDTVAERDKGIVFKNELSGESSGEVSDWSDSPDRTVVVEQDDRDTYSRYSTFYNQSYDDFSNTIALLEDHISNFEAGNEEWLSDWMPLAERMSKHISTFVDYERTFDDGALSGENGISVVVQEIPDELVSNHSQFASVAGIYDEILVRVLEAYEVSDTATEDALFSVFTIGHNQFGLLLAPSDITD